jgi:Mrp family chromosome partitioning ATPase
LVRDAESSPRVSIPKVRDSDPEDVAWGRKTAEALWRSGAQSDAIVWLRRAAQAAGEASDDRRALELARSAAELSEWIARRPAQASLVIVSKERELWRSPAAPLDVPRRVDDPRLVMSSDPDSARAAGFRLLRDNVLAKRARIVAIASPSPGEGKTTCAINLAFAMAERALSRVLLVEGNFFAPSLDRVFGIDRATKPVPGTSFPWLSPYRVAEVSRGLHVAALVREGPPRTFDRRWLDIAIEHLSAGAYDHVIVDGPSLDGSPLSLQIASVADGTLIAARSGETKSHALRRAAALVPKDRLLGVVLMDGEL